MRSFFLIQNRGKTNWLSAGGTLAFILLIFLIDSVFPAQNPMQLSKQKWLEDLHVAVKILTENHPNPYYRISSDEFQKNLASAERMISQSHSDEECFVAIRKLIASVKDGHTRLGTERLPEWQRIFPVRMYDFSDGIFRGRKIQIFRQLLRNRTAAGLEFLFFDILFQGFFHRLEVETFMGPEFIVLCNDDSFDNIRGNL